MMNQLASIDFFFLLTKDEHTMGVILFDNPRGKTFPSKKKKKKKKVPLDICKDNLEQNREITLQDALLFILKFKHNHR